MADSALTDPKRSALLHLSGVFRPEVVESTGVASALVGFQRGEQQVHWGSLRASCPAISPHPPRPHQPFRNRPDRTQVIGNGVFASDPYGRPDAPARELRARP